MLVGPPPSRPLFLLTRPGTLLILPALAAFSWRLKQAVAAGEMHR